MRLTAAFTVALGLVATRAAAEPTMTAMACIDAHASAQRAEKKGELRTARARYAECTSFECPAPIRQECDEWRGRVEQALPSIVVKTKDLRARVWIDGELVPLEKNGVARDVDPGPHRVRVEADGFSPKEENVVVGTGEKNRAVEVQLEPLPSKTPPPPPKKKSLGPFVLGGVGIVGLGVFTGLAVSAGSRYDTLDRTCAPSCNPDQVDGIRRSYVIADVALVVGSAALIAGAVWLIAQMTSHSPAPTNSAMGVSLRNVP